MFKMRRREEDLIIRELTAEEIMRNAKNATDSGNEDDNEPEADDGIPFTTKLRTATRKVHSVSDALVNAKLGIAMSDEKVWAEGLLIFYEVFRFLEQALARLSSGNVHFNKMNEVIQDIRRTEAFEEDLKYYFGANFLQEYEIRTQVSEYLKHLKTLEEREPLRLLAYVYHLYMGLLSGGQILKRKRELKKKLQRGFGDVLVWLRIRSPLSESSTTSNGPKAGNAVTTFSFDGRTISDIKKEIAFTMNDISCDLSNDEKESLLSESIIVFRRNNEIVGSIEKTGLTALKNLTGNTVALLLAILAVGTYFLSVYFRKVPTTDQFSPDSVDLDFGTPDSEPETLLNGADVHFQ